MKSRRTRPGCVRQSWRRALAPWGSREAQLGAREPSPPAPAELGAAAAALAGAEGSETHRGRVFGDGWRTRRLWSGPGARAAALPHPELSPPAASSAEAVPPPQGALSNKANPRPGKIIIMVLFVMIPLSN